MTIDQRKRDLAWDLLQDIKLAFPRFSIPAKAQDKARLVDLWAGAMSRIDVPDSMWHEALVSFLADASSQDNAPMPGDLLRHCRKAMSLAEQDPSRREGLSRWRAERVAERDSALGSVVGGVRKPSN